MSDTIARIADPEDLRVLVMLGLIVVSGALLAIAAAAQPFLRRADRGFGFRFVRRQ